MLVPISLSVTTYLYYPTYFHEPTKLLLTVNGIFVRFFVYQSATQREIVPRQIQCRFARALRYSGISLRACVLHVGICYQESRTL